MTHDAHDHGSTGQGDVGVPPAPRHVLTILAVSDLARASRFYGEAFGWPAAVEVPVYVELALPGGQRFGLYQREGFARNVGLLPPAPEAGAITATEVYLQCDDLGVAVERVTRAGGRLLSARSPRPWGDEVAYFADPDGNVLALAGPLPSNTSA